MLVATHCHTYYSFDCDTAIDDLVESCIKKGIGCTLITDHDVFGLTKEDLKKFDDKNIFVLNAIEFTTSEGAHIIGIHPNIKKFEKERYFYKSCELVKIIQENNGWISIPHPTHQTGIMSVGLSDDELSYCLSTAHFIEEASSKYGEFDIKDMLKKYKNLKPIVSDDAHRKEDVGIMLNKVTYENNSDNKYQEILSSLYRQSNNIYDEKSLLIRKYKKMIQSNTLYQLISKSMSKEFKNKIKKILKRGK
jgi:histidinol phosphatase-like PHP family hydrolase